MPTTNYLLDNFVDTNGTPLCGSGGHTSDSGNTYTVLTNQPNNPGTIHGDAFFDNATGASQSIAIANGTYDINAPSQATFNYGGTAASGSYAIWVGVRAQASGLATWANFICNASCTIHFGYYTTGGTYTVVATFTPSAQLPTGNYILTLAPTGQVYHVYLQRTSDGFYYNTGNSFQSGITPVLSVVDRNNLTAGAPLIGNSAATSSTNPSSVIKLAAGNAILIPPIVGCDMVNDRFARINTLSACGGTAPISYVIYRKTGAGAYSPIGNTQTITPYIDRSVAPSTSYTYKVVATDSNATPLTATSNEVTVSTNAPNPITLPTLVAPATPITSIVNGQAVNDTAGNLLITGGSTVIWDELYQMFFLYCVTLNASHTGPETTVGCPVSCYASIDAMNWTNLGIVFGQFGNYTFNGTTYTGTYSPIVRAHPTNGLYYLFLQAQANAGARNWLIASATSPAGPFNTFVAFGTPGPASSTDFNVLVDFDGSAYFYYARSATVAPLSGSWNSWGSSVTLNGDYECAVVNRYDHLVFSVWSPPGTYAYTAEFTKLQGTPLGSEVDYSNALSFTTPAQAIAAPAGYTNGYLGTTVGIDPTLAYGTQSFPGILKTPAGQYILCGTRWEQSPVLGGWQSPQVWLPISFDSLLQPTYPFVSSFTPQLVPRPTNTNLLLSH